MHRVIKALKPKVLEHLFDAYSAYDSKDHDPWTLSKLTATGFLQANATVQHAIIDLNCTGMSLFFSLHCLIFFSSGEKPIISENEVNKAVAALVLESIFASVRAECDITDDEFFAALKDKVFNLTT